MTKDPHTLDVAATVQDVFDAMKQHDVRHMLIVDNNELCGIVSDRDIGSYLVAAPAEGDPSDVTQKQRLQNPIADILSSNVISVQPEDEIRQIISLLIDEKIGAVPVVDPVTRRLAGIISYVDILREAEQLFE